MTPEQYATARRLRAGGMGTYRIAEVLGIKRSAVRYGLENPPGEKRGYVKARSRAWDGDDIIRPVVTDQEHEDRARRYALAPRDLTAAFCGDPLPGYSALDRR
jgi:hypothetical protein